jgi:16S rRNA (adenine1518-N6/adenine1519-N6)-dimethyltransferase
MYTLKKSLGQHFLKDENICKNIVEELKKCPIERLVEVGAGGGALTKYLLQIPNIDFKAVEVDDEKVIFLKNTYPQLKGKLIHKNFLDVEEPFDNPFSVIGNFPYNISTEILFKILDWHKDIECVVGMFQKEVAQRIASHEGNKVYGVTSVLIQAFFTVEYLFDVDENCFNPPPKVKSGVIKLLPRKELLEMRDQASFKRLVKAAFGQRRKTLRNACKQLFEAPVIANPIFNKRAEQLKVEEFAGLTYLMK